MTLFPCGFLVCPEDGDRTLLRNVGAYLPHYRKSHTSYLQPNEPQIPASKCEEPRQYKHADVHPGSHGATELNAFSCRWSAALTIVNWALSCRLIYSEGSVHAAGSIRAREIARQQMTEGLNGKLRFVWSSSLCGSETNCPPPTDRRGYRPSP